MLSQKQKLILFLISYSTMTGIVTLMKVFDRADFPAEMGLNLDVLLEKGLISISRRFDNGTASNYQVTEQGQAILSDDFNEEEVINYIKTMNYPNLLLDITQHYINKNRAINNR